MSSIIKSLSDVFTSLVELVWSFFTTAGDLVQKTASFVLKFASEVLDLFVNFFRGLIDLAGGIVGFVLGKLAYAEIGLECVYIDSVQATFSCLVCLLQSCLASCSTSATRVTLSRLATRSSTRHQRAASTPIRQKSGVVLIFFCLTELV